MKKILTVSVLAMAAVGAANATIVSESMLSSTKGTYDSTHTVEMAIKAAADAAAAAATAAENVGDASVAIDQGEGNENKIMITNSNGLVTTAATIPASQVSGLSNALSDKVAVAQGNDTAHQNKAMITDGSGNVTVGTISSGMITDGTIENADIANGTIAKAKLDSSVQASLTLADSAIQDVSDKQDVDNMVTETVAGDGPDGYGYATGANATSYYPSMATTGAMISNALQTTNSNIADLQQATVKHTPNQAVGNAGVPVYVAANGQATAVSVSSNAATSESGTSLMNEGAVAKTINALDVSAIGGGGASGIIKQVSEANGKISATAAQIVNADIAANAGIDASKITALASALSAELGNTEGNFVLTAKVTNNGVTYHWEDLGR